MEQVARPGRTAIEVSTESCRVAPSALSVALSRSSNEPHEQQSHCHRAWARAWMPEVCAMLVMDLVRRLPHRIADVLTFIIDIHHAWTLASFDVLIVASIMPLPSVMMSVYYSVDINMSQPLPVSSSDLEASQCCQCTGYQHVLTAASFIFGS